MVDWENAVLTAVLLGFAVSCIVLGVTVTALFGLMDFDFNGGPVRLTGSVLLSFVILVGSRLARHRVRGALP